VNYYDSVMIEEFSRLRGAIEPDKSNPLYILTVRGIGYKFADTDA